MSKINNQNNFNGNTEVNGSLQISNINIINNSDTEPRKALYEVEPIWRSPITMAILSWFSAITAVFPGKCIATGAFHLLNGDGREMMKDILYLGKNSILVFSFVMLSLIGWYLLGITRKQIRVPLFFNYAINGVGRRITIEKVHAKCPRCGADMKYCRENGIPVLQCKRNKDHCFEVDPAEDKLN